ncbi:MAG: hypothetical protein KKF54_06665 [Candidatus Omnitrophica bacterium]|nr:hypothetical protein [Candidatus Omnitrophota bacterium]
MKRKFVVLTVIVIMCLHVQGCAVVMAVKQPRKKDVSLLREGSPRGLLIAEFGAPIVTEEKNGKRHDIFKFTQGYSMPTKVGRSVFHAAADVFSCGLWEVIGTPTEAIFNGNEMTYEVSYDDNDRVESVSSLEKEDINSNN